MIVVITGEFQKSLRKLNKKDVSERVLDVIENIDDG
jgi:hypothetical protein